MRTANPALNDKVFAEVRDYSLGREEGMTIQGTVNKTGLLLLLLLIPAIYVWSMVFEGMKAGEMPPTVGMWIWGGLIGGLVMALITIFAKKAAMFTAPLYAIFEGLFLGGISAFFEIQFPGIVIQAVALTFGTLFCLLMAYTSGMIKATENFKMGVVAATGAVCLIYIVSIVLNLFGTGVPYIHGSGPIGIGFSLVVVTIAALNLVLDFDFIENGAEQGAPKYMEWYAAFGLLVTLVWLYLEILRLLAKLQSRR